MLTADLAQSWQRGGRTGPRLIETDDAGNLRDAEELIRLFDAHEGRARHEIERALDDYVGTGTDYRILRGLIKLLTDRCRFETASERAPAEIRRALFLKARAHHPLRDEREEREAVVAEAARELQCAPESVLTGLYADLAENQRLIEFESLTARELLDLYNLAQAQALLYRSVEMSLEVAPQSAEGYRALFGAIKAYRLIHTVAGSPTRGYQIRLDGPVSMFQRSQKYGIQMAVFLPALLLCEGWKMRAEIVTKQGRGASGTRAFFELTSEQKQFRSHYLAHDPYENPTIEKLARDWAKLDTPWTLEASGEVVDMGASAFIPDFVLCHPDGHKVYLEILGFWTPPHLKKRLEEFASAGLENFIIAAWEDLRGSREPLPRIPEHVLVFKTSLSAATVALKADSMMIDDK